MAGNRPPDLPEDNYYDDDEEDANNETAFFDWVPEFWIDFMNYIEESKFMTYLPDAMTYASLKASASYLVDTATLNISFDDLMFCMTLFVLFGENIELATSVPANDGPIGTALAVCMFTFCGELLLNSWSKSTVTWNLWPFEFNVEGYLFSFYWWFDLLAILSIFPDIPFIARPTHLDSISSKSAGGSNNYTNAGRVVRLVRLVRFIRLYRLAAERRRSKKQNEYLQDLIDSGEIDENEAERFRKLNFERESKLGFQLSNVILQYIIFLILIMLVILPLLSPPSGDQGPDYGTDLLLLILSNSSLSNTTKEGFVDAYINGYSAGQIRHPISILVSLMVSPFIQGSTYLDYGRFVNLREGSTRVDRFESTTINGVTYSVRAVFDDRQFLQVSSLYSIYLTIFVALVLLLSFIIMSGDVKRLVLKPIERMMNVVDVVAQDPLQPIGDLVINVTWRGVSKKNKAVSGQYETEILESSLEKVTGLLRVGFGEAGAGIIRSNLDVKSSSNSNGELINALLPGIRIYAIFGFCDIHHFEEINKALGRDVLTFVNTIADIVHSSVHTWSGQCNKNLGNAFVIVWRIGDEASLSNVLHLTASAIRHSSPLASTNEFSESMRPRGGNAFNDNNSKSSPRLKDDDNQSIRSGSAASNRRLPSSSDGSKNHSLSLDELSENASSSGRDKSSKSGRFSQRDSDAGQSDTSSQKARKNKKQLVVSIDLNKIPGVNLLADSALISYLKIVAEINRSNKVLAYRNEPRLLHNTLKVTALPATPRAGLSPNLSHRKLTASPSKSVASVSDFKVRMGFGLHAGWGIEGAVGSVFKVDATYLSPHVNMAARLETASKQYKVPILMSHQFHELLSDVVKTKTRQIDRVTVKGSAFPIGVFTYDCLQDQVFKPRTKSDKMLYSGKGRRDSLDNEDEMSEKSEKKEKSEKLEKVKLTPVPSSSNSQQGKFGTSAVSDHISLEKRFSPVKNLTEDLVSIDIDPLPPQPPSRPKSPVVLVPALKTEASRRSVSPEASSPDSELSPKKPAKKRPSVNFDLGPSTPSNPDFIDPEFVSPGKVNVVMNSKPNDRLIEQMFSFPKPPDAAPPAAENKTNDEASSDPVGMFKPIEERPILQKRTSALAKLFPSEPTEYPPPPPPEPVEVLPEPPAPERRVSLTKLESETSTIISDQLQRDSPNDNDEEDDEEGGNPLLRLYFATPDDSVDDIINRDPDIVFLREHVTQEFMDTFNEGYRFYTSGDWLKSKDLLEKSNEMMRLAAPSLEGDGPSQTLLKYMASHDFISPPNWKGFRALTSK